MDPTGADHELFGFGLKKALFNYMHGNCFEFPLQKWFDFKVPNTTIAPHFIKKAINEPELNTSNNYKVIWLGVLPSTTIIQKSKKGNKWEEMILEFHSSKNAFTINVASDKGAWLVKLLSEINIQNSNGLFLADIKNSYSDAGFNDFELFWDNKPITHLSKAGLLRI